VHTHLVGLLWALIAAQPLPPPPSPVSTRIAAYDVVPLADGVHGFVWKMIP